MKAFEDYNLETLPTPILDIFLFILKKNSERMYGNLVIRFEKGIPTHCEINHKFRMSDVRFK